MAVALIRHAQAGPRGTGLGEDRRRPLTGSGRRQAADLVDWLADSGITAVASSPYTRCIETVAPLAARLGLVVQIEEALAEEHHEAGLALVRRSWPGEVAMCSHGDVIPYVLAHLAAEDGLELGLEPRCQKGSVWVLEAGSQTGRFASAKYLPPSRA